MSTEPQYPVDCSITAGVSPSHVRDDFQPLIADSQISTILFEGGAEIRLQLQRVNPRAHDANGLCVIVIPAICSLGLKSI